MQTYWVWYDTDFLGRAREGSKEVVAGWFGVDAEHLRLVPEQELSFQEWLQGDVQLRD